MQSPELQLYNKVFELCRGYGLTTVDVKEMSQELPYPFVAVSKTSDGISKDTYDSFSGDTSIIFTIYSMARDKGAHDYFVHNLKMEMANLETLPNYQLVSNDVSTNTMIYTESNQELLQTTIVAEFNTH